MGFPTGKKTADGKHGKRKALIKKWPAASGIQEVAGHFFLFAARKKRQGVFARRHHTTKKIACDGGTDRMRAVNMVLALLRACGGDAPLAQGDYNGRGESLVTNKSLSHKGGRSVKNRAIAIAVLVAVSFAVFAVPASAATPSASYTTPYRTTYSNSWLSQYLSRYFPVKPAPAPAPTPAPAPAPAPTPTTPPAPTPAPTPTPAPAPSPDAVLDAPLTAMEKQMVDLVNQERVSRGLAALQVDMRLVKVARMKSMDMIKNNYFGHTSPVYGSPFDMMKAQGITYKTAGENLAGAPTVERAHTGLMNSEGHRANILKPAYTKIGIGIIKGGPYGLMLTQEFIG